MKLILKTFKILLLLLFTLITLAILSIPLSIYEMPDDLLPVEQPAYLLLKNVNYLDVKSGLIVSNQDIHIIDGRISAIKPMNSSKLDNDAQVIDLQGTYVIPGLFDMHVHLHDRKYLGLYLSYGVTSLRNLRGLPMHLRWKNELQDNQWLGSNLYTSSPVLDGEKYSHILQQVVTSPAEARALVRQYKRDGYDLIKAYGYLDKDVFTAITEEAERLNFAIAKHGPNAIAGLPLSSNNNLQSLEHVEDIFQGPLNFSFDEITLDNWLNEFKQLQPTITPTLATFAHLTEISEHKQTFINSLPLDTLNPLYRMMYKEATVKRWLNASKEQSDWNIKELAFLKTIVKKLDEQKITMLVGSDGGTMYMPAGLSTYQEIALMAESGLATKTVLQAATINAATAMAIDADYGSIEPGKVADLVILSANPIENLPTLQNPHAVVKNGQWLNNQTLKELRKSGENPSNLYVSLGRLLEDILTRML